ncbi:MAG TPA: M15 family metallopeptidase [bacterium]|nr:M15 family metallopeptidase [bacterium]
MNRKKVFTFIIFILLLFVHLSAELPEGFVYLNEIIPEAQLEMRYCGKDNFLGKKVDGYNQPKAILSQEAARALKKVAGELEKFGFGIKIFDAYRPQRAVDNFVEWAKNLDDTTMKYKYYPDVEKKNLFEEGYIAGQSSHSRGSTVDLTIMIMEGDSNYELDMGSGFDYFSRKSWPTSRKVTPQQRANRLLLQQIMTKYGFVPYSREWWHFTYENEPYPNTYFDFPVE